MIQDHIREYIGLNRYHARLYRTMQEYTGPYKTIQVKPYLTFVMPTRDLDQSDIVRGMKFFLEFQI